MANKKSNYSYELNGVLEYMTDVLGKEYPTDIYGSEYLIVSILDKKRCHANLILDNCLMSDNMNELRNIYISHITENLKPIPSNLNNDEGEPRYSEMLTRILENAENEARRFQAPNIGTEHVLLSILNPSYDFKLNNVFGSMGVNYEMIARKCEMEKPKNNRKNSIEGMMNSNGGIKVKGNVNIISTTQNHEYIDKFTININKQVADGKFDTLIGRDREISQIIKVFSRRRKNNAILVGPVGVGKTSIVYGLAERIINGEVPPTLMGKEIVMLDIMALVSGTNYRGMLEDRVDNLFKELKRSEKHILFLDDIHMMLRSGTKEKDTDISGMVGNILNGGEVQVIAATNNKEYRNTVEFNPAVGKKLQRISVEPNTHNEAFEVLMGTKRFYERFHNVYYGSEVIDKIVRLSERYISNSCLPDSAFDIMDSTGAYVSLRTKGTEEMISLKKRLDEIEVEKNNLINTGNFERIDAINLEEADVQRRIDEYKESVQNRSVIEVTEDDVAVVISEITNVPITKLNSNDKKNIAKIDEKLKESIIGQDEAINEICRSIKRNRVGLGYKSATKGVYLMCGESGVGKCVSGETKVKIRNKKTLEIQEVTINQLIKLSGKPEK